MRSVLLSFGFIFLSMACNAEIISASSDAKSLALTVYNNNLAFVKDTRKVNFKKGLNNLSWREVSAEVMPESVMLNSKDNNEITVLEHNFNYEVLSYTSLLNKYIGKDVWVYTSNPATGIRQKEVAKVLSAAQGLVLQFADRIEAKASVELAFPVMPEKLFDQPTMSLVINANAGDQLVELSYLTSGLSWQANYVANLSGDAKFLDLSAFVAIHNTSGISYNNAMLQLMAGSVNKSPPRRENRVLASKVMMEGAMSAPEPEMQSVGENYLYTIATPTSLEDRQIKQISLLTARHIPVQQEFLLLANDWQYVEGGNSKQKPKVFLEFINQSGELGKPLPAGKVRVYANDQKGSAQFLGEDFISHTAEKEKIRIQLGESFDVFAEKSQQSVKRINNKTIEIAYQITIHNSKKNAITVRTQEPFSDEWQFIKSSQPLNRKPSSDLEWLLTVPAGDSKSVDYIVRVKSEI